MSTAIETAKDAAREFWQLTGERDRLEESIKRAKRDGDAVRLLELRERAKVLDAHIQRAQAEELTRAISEQEREREALELRRDEQAVELAELSAVIQELADQMAEAQEMWTARHFELGSTENKLNLNRQTITAKRRELSALVEGM